MPSPQQTELFSADILEGTKQSPATVKLAELRKELTAFNEFGEATVVQNFPDIGANIPVYVNEFWTSKQRAANRLHEISYRACFKPQLPRFFIDRLTKKGDIVYDPFMGRGTTPLEAALLGRIPFGCDINPLCRILLEPRLSPPNDDEVSTRLSEIDLEKEINVRDDLLAFYHPKTLRRICNLRDYLVKREAQGKLDGVDRWIRMVATNRLTGHSAGFFSVYTLPPNQATSIKAQLKINAKREQTPPDRDVVAIILKKSKALIKGIDDTDACRLKETSPGAKLLSGSCDGTPQIEDSSVHLVVTSPPFLDVVDYQGDNWLRCWFNNIDLSEIEVWQLKKVEVWMEAMTRVFKELKRVLVPDGYVAFEVGEIHQGKTLMESLVVPAAAEAGLVAELILINDQKFTKTANCWGVSNQTAGTNTNRIVLLRKLGE